ncbi:molybdopterin molybdotransferase MoeA [Kribbella sp.]|uniref:molybdopterin molybdotransferase MoeA n=1 Tax=Kribbella sp. TaxID=1871183 RepID=UPI002D2F3C02|nr:molybdopterin molybdotransferase MoeA [Kribbella sp.]HZX01774.1 molybdopterin molybdotransferase MoeA [Kribbella sp.]
MEDKPGGTPARRLRDAVEWDVARRLAYALARPGRVVSRGLSDADGCVLGTPLVAPVAVPAVDRSAMDGYAVRGNGPWRIVGHIAAGVADPGALEDGEATGIVTGATLPAGTTSVVRSEDAVVTSNRLERPAKDAVVSGDRLEGPAEDAVVGGDWLEGPAGGGRHIRRAGEECEPGDQLLPAGVIVTPAVLGLAATVGLNRLTVVPPPTVAALITGDELVHRGPSSPGRVRDAIGPMLPGLITRAGARNGPLTHLRDDRDRLVEALKETEADLILVSGSSAAGPADHLRAVLTDLDAQMVVDGVACRPGHPQALAQLPDGRLVLGLPGNPHAALVAFLTLGVAAITRMRGLALPTLANVAVPGGITCHPTNTRLVPVRLTPQGAVPVGHDGAAMLRGPAVADALAVVAPGPSEAIAARLLPIDPGARPWIL